MDKKAARLRPLLLVLGKDAGTGATRLVVHRTPRHIYAQVIAANGSEVLASASTVKAISEALKYTGNADAATAVGKAIAERAIAKRRSGTYLSIVPVSRYHGRCSRSGCRCS